MSLAFRRSSGPPSQQRWLMRLPHQYRTSTATAMTIDSRSSQELSSMADGQLSATFLWAYSVMRGSILNRDRGPLYKSRMSKSGPPFLDLLASSKDFEIPEARNHDNKLFADRDTTTNISEAYLSLGYIKVNDAFVDPDSELSICEAISGASTIPIPPLPGFVDPRAPHEWMQTQDAIDYAKFAEYVEEDDEKDMRLEEHQKHYRISPAQFLKWAEGAVKFVKQEIPSAPDQSLVPPEKEISKEERRPKLKVYIPQRDEETGDCLSPVYSVDEDPIPLRTPPDVNLEFLPGRFAYSYPTDDKIYQKLFFDGDIDSGEPMPDGTENFTENGLKDALGNSDTELGARRMLEMRQEFHELVAQRDSCIYDAHRTAGLNAILEKEVDRLEREVASLQKEKQKRAEGFITARRRRYIEMMKGYQERLMQERNKAIATIETFGNASGELREKAGFLVQEKVKLLEELGNPVKRANPWQGFHRGRNF